MQHLSPKFPMGVYVSSVASWGQRANRASNLEWKWCERHWPQSRHLKRYGGGDIKKKEPAEVNVAYADYLNTHASSGIEVEIRTEADEFWSYVGKKANQRWTWYALDRETGVILAHQNGRRTDEMCEHLIAKLDIFPITAYYTDNWQSYAKYIPEEQHYIGKKDTWKIERTNLNFRTHLKRLHRKTLCFSKNEAMHDKVIGLYIEYHYYKKQYYARATWSTD